MSSTLFHSTTLNPTFWKPEPRVVPRIRALEQLNAEPTSGTIGWMIGPLGAGKSTTAYQWAEALQTEVLLVSARTPILGEGSILHPPTEFGLALQNLLNSCSDDRKLATVEEISTHLELVVALSKERSQPFILDDLELIRRESMNILIGLFAQALPQLKVNRALFVSRTMDSTMIEGIQAQRSLRLVLPPAFEFDPTETMNAYRLGIFGSASIEQVENARKRSSGWITGMLAELHGHGGNTISAESFRINVLNNMVLLQPQPVLQAMVVSSLLPLNNLGIWDRWFTKLGIPSWVIPSTLAQLPTRALEETGKDFVIVPALAEALRNVHSITVSNETHRDLLLIAMEWYIERGATSAAQTLAKDESLDLEYLRLIKPRARELSRSEGWQEIGDLLSSLPMEVITSDADISFWYGFALTASNRWSEMVEIHYRVADEWASSESPLVRGRNHLNLGWIARAEGNYTDALTHFQQAYDTLPPSAHQERMYAAASAGTSASHIRLGQESLPWRKRTAFELSHLPPRQRWWHGNMGPIALGYVASSGRPELAHSQAKQQVAGLREVGPDLSWRYLLLMATIDTEMMRLGSAAEIIERARPYIQSPMQQQLLAIAESKVLAAHGNFTAAMAKLAPPPYSAGRSINNEFASKLAFARHAFDSGDVATAHLTLGSAAWPMDSWPRIFGIPHPNLILAMTHADTGDKAGGLELGNQVLQEARYRRDRYIEIQSHTVLAHIHHQSDDAAERDRNIMTAMDLNSSIGYDLVFSIKGHDIRELVSGESNDAENQNSHSQLTSRESEVLSMVARSLSNKQIAEQMFISVSTVKNHLASVNDKLGTNNRHTAVRTARNLGLVDD